MKNALLATILLFAIAPVASARWSIHQKLIEIQVGETVIVHPTFESGVAIQMTWTSTAPSVADVFGYVGVDGHFSNGVTVTGVSPGTAYIIGSGDPRTMIVVHPAPFVQSIALPAPTLTLPVAASVNLSTALIGSTATSCIWFRGRIGDMSTRITDGVSADTFTYKFTATEPGESDIWVLVGTQSGSQSTQFEITVTPPPKRRVSR